MPTEEAKEAARDMLESVLDEFQSTIDDAPEEVWERIENRSLALPRSNRRVNALAEDLDEVWSLWIGELSEDEMKKLLPHNELNENELENLLSGSEYQYIWVADEEGNVEFVFSGLVDYWSGISQSDYPYRAHIPTAWPPEEWIKRYRDEKYGESRRGLFY